MPVEFKLLGPLEVVIDGERRSVASAGEKAVLALLLLSAGRVVPRDTLADALWGAALPTNPANAVQGRISRLRRALDEIGIPGALVAARGPGYVAEVDVGQVDVHRFSTLVRQARSETGNGKAAARLYSEALQLWRGPALADFASQSWALPEVTRLEELRLAAIEERIQLELELESGRHTGLVDELETLAISNPLRERLHSQLMLALYRTGRQADALAAYRRLQHTLDEELGLDPSKELRDLEQAILRQDSKLRAPVRELPTALTNLPVRVTSFVGRQRLVGQVSGLLSDYRLVTLTGPGGAGKTSLALRVAGDTAGRFPDGVWLARLAGVEDPEKVADVVAESVGAQRPAGRVTESLVGYLRDRSALVVLDNCEHLVQSCAELVERLLTAGSRLRLLATSREPLRVPGEVQLMVPPLASPPPDFSVEQLRDYGAAELFLDRALTIRPDLRIEPVDAVDIGRICRQLDGLPLALELAAARARTLPIRDLATRLDDRFRLLTTGNRTAEARQRTLRATVDWSHQLLSPTERVLFRRLSVFRVGWTMEAAEAVVADETVPAAEMLDLLASLADRSLIQADTAKSPGRFRMLETLRQYAQERADEAGETALLAGAHARYFTALAEAGQAGLRGPDQGRWLRTLRQERRNIDAAIAWAQGRTESDPDLGLRLVAAMGWFWYFTSDQNAVGQIDNMLDRHGDTASRAARARAVQAKSIVARPGSCIVHPSPVCAAAARQSLDELDALAQHHLAAYSRTLLAVEAIAGPLQPPPWELLTMARDIFRGSDDQWGLALTLFVEMELHFGAGKLRAGRDTFHQALALFRELGDHWGISAVQYHLGMALHRAGLLSEALEVYRDALSEGRIGLTNTVQYALANLGHISVLIGDLDGADGYFSSAQAVARELGAEASVLALLGQGHLARLRNQPTEAAAHYTSALQRMSRAETPDWAAIALNGLGRLAHERGDVAGAQRQHREAWNLVAEAGTPIHPAAATACEGLAAVAADRGYRRTARRFLDAAAGWRQARAWPASPLERRDLEQVAASVTCERT
ncbi:MAG TPA: BTAD domain-containing putative transcriptional regulator [Propionibacteriaceae bacterium]|nr:BTAD domain-containing putative transcriptional regulator [Propionibacteriaceae bacterium]